MHIFPPFNVFCLKTFAGMPYGSIFAPRKRKNGVAGSSFKDIGVEIVGK
jgi:hypothetical protein